MIEWWTPFVEASHRATILLIFYSLVMSRYLYHFRIRWIIATVHMTLLATMPLSFYGKTPFTTLRPAFWSDWHRFTSVPWSDSSRGMYVPRPWRRNRYLVVINPSNSLRQRLIGQGFKWNWVHSCGSSSKRPKWLRFISLWRPDSLRNTFNGSVSKIDER